MRSLYLSRHERPEEGEGYIAVPVWVRAVMVYVGGPLFGFEQYWLCVLWSIRGWPSWPGLVASRAWAWLADGLARWGTPMRWNAPDGGLPGEIGFWSPADGTNERSITRIWVVHTSGGVTQ